MTALERAKRFVQKHAAETALVIVPLAMAAPAHASSLTFSAGTATLTSTGLTPHAATIGFDSLPNGGIQFFADYPFDVVPTPASGSGFSGQFSLTLTLTGSASGQLDMPLIPVSWDYALNGLSLSTLQSAITFAVKTTTPNTYDVGTGSVSPNPPLPNQSFSGNLALSNWAPLLPETLSSWSVILTASGSYNIATPTAALTLSIPNHSIDIAPLADLPGGTVPEPASLALLGSGLTLMIRRQRRNLAQRQQP